LADDTGIPNKKSRVTPAFLGLHQITWQQEQLELRQQQERQQLSLPFYASWPSWLALQQRQQQERQLQQQERRQEQQHQQQQQRKLRVRKQQRSVWTTVSY
jgi:hypothetical protein